MDAPSAPAAPDPTQLVSQQAKANKDTAVSQFGLNAVNQSGPAGSLSYRQVGTWEDGTPRFEAVQSYAPGEQAVFDANQRARLGYGNLANDQIGRVSQALSQPFSLDNEATEARLYELGSKRLDPRFERESASLETDLINRGIRPGSEAYKTMRGQFSEGKNDAYNQLLLTGRNQAVAEALTERNQPLAELNALRGGYEVADQNYVNTPTAGVAPTDTLGANQMALNQQNQQFQAEQNQNNALMSGLFGLGSSVLSFGMGGWGSGGRSMGGMGLGSGTGRLY
jgi:hypothetical protein